MRHCGPETIQKGQLFVTWIVKPADVRSISSIGLFRIESSYLVSLLVLYVIAHGGIVLVLNAVYWDDWTVRATNIVGMLKRFESTGSMFNLRGYLHFAMLSAGPWLYKIATLVLMFFAGLLLWKIIERHDWINIDARYTIVLLFLVLPFYNARVALIDFPYTLQYFLFFLAWYLLGKNRLLSLGLFFLSFETNSMLVFYSLPIAEWYFRGGNTLNLKSACAWGLRRIDYMVWPFAYWFIKITYFKAFGPNEGYNENYGLRNFLMAPLVMGNDLMHLDVSIVLLVVAILLSLPYLKSIHFDDNEPHRKLLLLGVVAFACSVIPYWLVGAFPTFSTWLSRHQLLMPLGIALQITWLLGRFPQQSRQMIFALIIATSIAVNVKAYIDFYQDWRKQEELVLLMSQNHQIREASLVIFDDHTKNIQNRTYRFYEWNGLMRLAYGDETRFGLDNKGMEEYFRGGYDKHFNERSIAKDHVRQPNEKSVVVKIDRASTSSDIFQRIEEIVRGDPRYSLSVAGL